MKQTYIVLTQEFCEDERGHAKRNLRFNYAVTLDGRYVASVNALAEFPELFEGIEPERVELGDEDFPAS